MRIKTGIVSGLLALSAAFSAGMLILTHDAGARAALTWRGTILCTAKMGSGHRSLAVDESGRLLELTLGRAVAPGLRVELQVTRTPMGRRALAARDVGTVRVLRSTSAPVVVRAKLIEDGDSRYRFDRHGRPWGCPVTFGNAAAVSVAQLVLSDRSAQITLVVRNGRLVHRRPQQKPLAQPARQAKATAAVEHFVALLARGDSIALCSTVSRDILLFYGGRYGGRDGCVMAFDSAKFVYRDHYGDAAVTRVALFDLGGRSYALATIARHIGNTRAILILERGKYRYLRDFSLSPIELW